MVFFYITWIDTATYIRNLKFISTSHISTSNVHIFIVIYFYIRCAPSTYLCYISLRAKYISMSYISRPQVHIYVTCLYVPSKYLCSISLRTENAGSLPPIARHYPISEISWMLLNSTQSNTISKLHRKFRTNMVHFFLKGCQQKW